MEQKRRITIAIILTIGIFIIDVRTPVGYANWLLYFIPFFVAASALSHLSIPIPAAIVTLLITASYFVSPLGGNLTRAIANRAMGILVLWWVSFIMMKRRQAEEALEGSYQELERRVDERTAELTQINASLQTEIAERKRAEEALRESEAGYRLLFQTMLHGVVYQDAQGRIISMNPAAVRILGKTREEFLGETSVSVDDDTIRQDGTHFPGLEHPSMVALRTGKEVRNVIMGVYNPREKGYRWITINATPLSHPGENRPYQVYTVFEDITERRRTEDNLKKTMIELERSNRELEQFAYAVSHDLQEPLRTISGFIDLLAEKYKGKLDQKADTYISFAIDGATRMSDVINDLLAYSRVGTRGKQFEPVEMSTVFKKTVDNLKRAIEEGHAVITSDQLPEVYGDESQLIQLLQNLIGNAVKFRKRDVRPRIHVSAERKGNEWLFAVHDNGIGIKPEFRERVFTIFQRLHTREEYPGTGLGLAICRRIVERHGGRIWAESNPGEGSTFSFTLPAEAEKKKWDTRRTSREVLR